MNVYFHPLYGSVTIERILAGGNAIVLTTDNESAVVPLDTLTLALELGEAA